MEYRLPKDDQPYNPKGQFKSYQFESANEISLAMYSTKDCKTLVDSITRSKEIVKVSLWQMVLFHLNSTSCGSVPHTQQPQETADQLPELYLLPGAPFVQYNYLPAYLAPMTPPLTLQPNFLQEYVAANESTYTQMFGVMYITLTGLIDSIVPASISWALLGKLLSYIVKLAPILWWALLAGSTGCPTVSSQDPQAGSLTSAQGSTGSLSGPRLPCVNSLPPLALDQTVFSRCTKKAQK
ncbi:hypothetical protein DSO57_1009233 [Entomophthora muscae]|uniref:Uncharacterized protein n=1 Tax=Entomophthora muscae TaxID=34485 RepID=A0ACC2THG4_9FUNG|nr:hypothetical protein DSO57_1009233 [Entomophthora muscae]